MEEKVSVIIPMYNCEQTILPTLRSVLDQSYKPLETILVDDGSSDHTFGVCKKLGQRFSTVKIISQENAGVGAARNRGIKEAIGTHIAFCDHDDLWDIDKLERQIKMFSSHQVGLVYSGVRYKFSDGRVHNEKHEPYEFLEGHCFEELLLRNIIPSISAIVPKVIFQRVGMFSESKTMSGSDDRNMWLRIAHDYELRAVKETLVTHVITGYNFSLNETKMMHASLACLDDISKRFNFSTSSSKLALKAAYTEAYAHYGHNFFYRKDYKSARSCLLKSFIKGRRNGEILMMIAATVLSPTLVERLKKVFFRSARKELSRRKIDNWRKR